MTQGNPMKHIETMGRIAHEAERVWQDDHSGVPGPDWKHLSEDAVTAKLSMVCEVIRGKTTAVRHEKWRKSCDPDHPNNVEYMYLTADARRKYRLFEAIVRALADR